MKAFISVFIACLLSACQPKTASVQSTIEPQCMSDQSRCQVETDFGKIEVLFDVAKVQAEVPFSIVLKSDSAMNNLMVSAYMEGKDMFMGKVPVFFESRSDANTELSPVHTMHAETLLASCSEDIMTWRLWITLSNQVKDKNIATKPQKTQFFIDFTSSRY